MAHSLTPCSHGIETSFLVCDICAPEIGPELLPRHGMTHGMRLRFALIDAYAGRIIATTDNVTDAVRVANDRDLSIVDGLTGERF